jgi:hypothetical protein
MAKVYPALKPVSHHVVQLQMAPLPPPGTSVYTAAIFPFRQVDLNETYRAGGLLRTVPSAVQDLAAPSRMNKAGCNRGVFKKVRALVVAGSIALLFPLPSLPD